MAKGAAEDFEKVIQDPPYTDLTTRFIAHRGSVLQISQELAELDLDTQLSVVSGQKFSGDNGALLEKAKLQLDSARDAQSAVDTKQKVYDAKVAKNLVELGVANQGVKTADAAIKQAKQAVRRYDAALALLHAGVEALAKSNDDPTDEIERIQLLFATLTKKLPADQDAPQTVADALGVPHELVKALDGLVTQIDAKRDEIDALDRKSPDYPKKLAEVLKGIDVDASARLLEIYGKTVGTQALAAEIVADESSSILVLNIALEIAKTRKKKIEIELEHAQRVVKLNAVYTKALENYVTKFEQVITGFEETIDDEGWANATVREVAESLIDEARFAEEFVQRQKQLKIDQRVAAENALFSKRGAVVSAEAVRDAAAREYDAALAALKDAPAGQGEDAITQRDEAKKALEDAEAKLEDANDELNAALEQRDKTFVTLRNAQAERDEAKNRLYGLYLSILRILDYSVRQGHELALFDEEIRTVEAQRDLRLTLINLEEREIYIRRGLEGLVEFHSGGFDGSEVDDLVLNIVQTIGLGALLAV